MATENYSNYTIDKKLNAKKFRFALVVSEWNKEITESLYQGAYDTLIKHKSLSKNITRVDVPGSFELIYAANILVKSKKYDAIIILGSVIQGETKHFDFVCQGVTTGIAHLNATQNIPIVFGLLTDNTLQQAKDRSGGKLGNKGIDCAIAAVKLAYLKNR